MLNQQETVECHHYLVVARMKSNYIHKTKTVNLFAFFMNMNCMKKRA